MEQPNRLELLLHTGGGGGGGCSIGGSMLEILMYLLLSLVFLILGVQKMDQNYKLVIVISSLSLTDLLMPTTCTEMLQRFLCTYPENSHLQLAFVLVLCMAKMRIPFLACSQFVLQIFVFRVLKYVVVIFLINISFWLAQMACS